MPLNTVPLNTVPLNTVRLNTGSTVLAYLHLGLYINLFALVPLNVNCMQYIVEFLTYPRNTRIYMHGQYYILFYHFKASFPLDGEKFFFVL